MAIASGAPGAQDLADALVRAAGESPSGAPLFQVADRLETCQGRLWVQERTAEIVKAARIIPSPALQALTLVSVRIVLTTNYDDAIELAAATHGLKPVTVTTRSAPQVLRGPRDGELLVVHLHGSVHDPSSIVLSAASYDDAYHDEGLRLVVQALSASRTLVFLGHSLDTREAHLRRDVRRTAELFGPGHHMLIFPSASTAVGDLVTFKADTGVAPEPIDDPLSTFEFVIIVARILGAPPLRNTTSPLRRCPPALEAAYQPLPLAPASEVATEDRRALWLYSTYVGNTPIFAEDLGEQSRLLLIGRPGSGKTQIIRRLAAAESPYDSVYLRLAAVQVNVDWEEDPAQVLVNWVETAGCASRDGLPQVSVESLEHGLYAFYLDGLDERQGGRRAVVATIAALAERYPQHRWVVTSRRIAEVPAGAVSGFTEYETVPSREWTHRFAQQRGVTAAQLDAITAGVPGLDELIDIPLFAAAAIDSVIKGEALPGSPLRLLLSFASKGLDEEQARLRTDRDAVDTWLDRLALALLVAAVDGIDRGRAAAPLLRGPLAEEVTVDWLSSRALVMEQDGAVRFENRTLRDARAAQAILQRPNAEQLLSELAFVDLAGERHLRPEWRFAVDLLLADDRHRWVGLVDPVDPLAAARAMPPDADDHERQTAIETICGWYRNHRIFIPRTNEGQLLDDLAAVAKIAQGRLPAVSCGALLADLESPDRALRANAIAILSAGGAVADLQPRLESLITDRDSVVRRQAAQVIADHHLDSYTRPLVDQAAADSDTLARQAMVTCAIAAARDDPELEQLIADLPTRLKGDARAAIDRRWDRDRQLAFLAASRTATDTRWLESIAGSRPAWTGPQVEVFTELWFRTGSPYADAAVRRVMSSHPEHAVRGALRATNDPARPFGLGYLLDPLSDEQLCRLEQEADPSAAPLFAAHRHYRSQPNVAAALPTATASVTDLASLIRLDDLDTILATAVGADEIYALDTEHREALIELVRARWLDPATGTSPILAIRRSGPNQWSYDKASDPALADLGIQLRLPLSEAEWVAAVDHTLSEDHQGAALASTYRHEWDDTILERFVTLDDHTLSNLIACLPSPWPPPLAVDLTEKCFASGSEQTQLQCAEHLAADGHIDLLHHWASTAGTHAANVALAHLGYAEAEHRLLKAYQADGYPATPHWAADRSWIADVRHQENGSLVFEALRTMLRRGDEPNDLEAVFRAVNRCLGDAAPEMYTELIEDDLIPDAAFLWYQRQACIAGLIATAPPDIPALTERLFGPPRTSTA